MGESMVGVLPLPLFHCWPECVLPTVKNLNVSGAHPTYLLEIVLIWASKPKTIKQNDTKKLILIPFKAINLFQMNWYTISISTETNIEKIE